MSEETAVKSKTLKFARKKETKNKAVFEEITTERPLIGSLYVDKWFVGASKELAITINLN